MDEIARDEPPGLSPDRCARLAVEPGGRRKPAMDLRRRTRRDDEAQPEPRRELDRRARKRPDIRRNRVLHRPRRDAHVLEGVIPALVRERLVARPETLHQLDPFGEDCGILFEIGLERPVFVAVVAAAGGEIDAPARQQIEARPLLGDADRMMERQDGHRGGKTDALRPRCDIGEREFGARHDAQ